MSDYKKHTPFRYGGQVQQQGPPNPDTLPNFTSLDRNKWEAYAKKHGIRAAKVNNSVLYFNKSGKWVGADDNPYDTYKKNQGMINRNKTYDKPKEKTTSFRYGGKIPQFHNGGYAHAHPHAQGNDPRPQWPLSPQDQSWMKDLGKGWFGNPELMIDHARNRYLNSVTDPNSKYYDPYANLNRLEGDVGRGKERQIGGPTITDDYHDSHKAVVPYDHNMTPQFGESGTGQQEYTVEEEPGPNLPFHIDTWDDFPGIEPLKPNERVFNFIPPPKEETPPIKNYAGPPEYDYSETPNDDNFVIQQAANEVAPDGTDKTSTYTDPKTGEVKFNWMSDTKKKYNPSAYFATNRVMDGIELVNNLMQTKPPSKTYRLPQFIKSHLDQKSIARYDQNIKQQAAAALRSSNETTQAGDKMKFDAALSKNVTDAYGNNPYYEQLMQNRNANIAGQNQMNLQKTNILNAEMEENYRIAQDFQNTKNAMISESLQNIRNTNFEEANYWNKREAIERQEAENARHIADTEDISLKTLQYQINQDLTSSTEYKEWASKDLDKINRGIEEKITEELGAKPANFESLEAEYSEYLAVNAKNEKNIKELGDAPVYVDGEDKEAHDIALDAYDTSMAGYEKIKTNLDVTKTGITQGLKWKDRYKELARESEDAGNQESRYFKDHGIPTNTQILQDMAAIIKRRRR